jgi:hypothetical protein
MFIPVIINNDLSKIIICLWIIFNIISFLLLFIWFIKTLFLKKLNLKNIREEILGHDFTFLNIILMCFYTINGMALLVYLINTLMNFLI